MIIVRQKRETMVNNEYTIKQYIILMYVHTYYLYKWDTVYIFIIISL